MQNFTITKRDGQKDRFSLDKIMNAILKAFESVEEPIDLASVSKILSRLNIHNDIKVEDIQNQVEVALMQEGHYKVAKSFMLYRQQHTEDRETLQKLQFLSDYMDASNAATGSKYDANANVEHKNIATLIGELPKSNFIRLNRRLLTDRIKKMYGKELADEYIEKLTHHFIYKNDETSLANYCASITMYPWLLGGTVSIGGNDIGFEEVLTAVAMKSVDDVKALIETKRTEFDTHIKSDLKQTYRMISQAAGKETSVIVAGYPTLLNKDGFKILFFDIPSEKTTLLNDVDVWFNGQIRGIVNDLRGEGMNIYFVDVIDGFSGHEAYTETPYINEVIIGAQPEDIDKSSLISGYSIHPNESGAAVYAMAVQNRIE